MHLHCDGHAFDALFMYGGSLQIVSYIRELVELEQTTGAPISTNVHSFAGSSAGAIVALQLAAGTSTAVLKDLWVNMLEVHKPRITTLWSHQGLDDGAMLERCMRAMFEQLNVDLDVQIQAFEKDKCVSLDILVFDLAAQRVLPVPKSATLWEALRATTCIPLIFTPARIDGRVYIDALVRTRDQPDALDASKRWLLMNVAMVLTNSVDMQDASFQSTSAYASAVLATLLYTDSCNTRPHVAWEIMCPLCPELPLGMPDASRDLLDAALAKSLARDAVCAFELRDEATAIIPVKKRGSGIRRPRHTAAVLETPRI